MKDDLDKVQQRTLQYGYVDGLMECAFGGLCLLLGLYFYAQATLPPESLLIKILDVSLVLIVLGGSFLIKALVTVAKEHITYPRTGYIAYRQARGLNRWVRTVIAAGISMLITALLTLSFANLIIDFAWMPAVSGAVIGATMLVIAFRTMLTRFYILSMIAVVIGTGLAFAGSGNIFGLGIFYFLFGLAISTSGGITLYNYLRQAPPPAKDSNEC
jgi:hypothetical protein